MNVDEIVTKGDLIEFEKRLISRLNDNENHKKPVKYLRSKDVCNILGISASTLQNLRLRKSIPYRKIGGTIFYNLDDIERLAEK